MCKLKSAIILKDSIFMPDYDSHTDMLQELGIEDNRKNSEKLFVRAELYPKDDDVFSSIDTWIFKVDQDILPNWFVQGYEETRMRDAVKEWAKNHIHIGVDVLKIDSGSNHYIKDCKDVIVCGNGTVNKVCGNGTVKYVYENGTVISSPYTKWNNANSLIICDNATFKDNCTKTIYQAGDWKLVSVENGKTVGEVKDDEN